MCGRCRGPSQPTTAPATPPTAFCFRWPWWLVPLPMAGQGRGLWRRKLLQGPACARGSNGNTGLM
eukprot:2653635-Heterocapsa_arctica.AAC.1